MVQRALPGQSKHMAADQADDTGMGDKDRVARKRIEKASDALIGHANAFAVWTHVIPVRFAEAAYFAFGDLTDGLAGVVSEIDLHQPTVRAIVQRIEGCFRAQQFHGDTGAMKRACDEVELGEIERHRPQQPSVRARLLAAVLGEGRIVLRAEAAMKIVRAFAMADEVERQPCGSTHMTKRTSSLPRTRKPTPCGSSSAA